MISEAPRTLGWRALWLAVQERPRSLLFGIAALVIPAIQGVVFLFVFAPFVNQLQVSQAASTGKQGPGEIVSIERADGFSLNGIEPRQVKFRYRVDGSEREGSMMTLSVAKVEHWKKGEPVTVQYDVESRAAAIVGLEPAEESLPRAVVIVSIAGWLIVAVPFLGYGILGVRRKYQLLKHGVPGQGKLISLELAGSPLFFWPQANCVAVGYSYLDSTGRELSGHARTHDLTFATGKQKGNSVDILVLPTDERRSTILDGPTERVLLRA
ncbi:MAG TPA: DUF3592 domain-containing protein [Planctomycetaceae bacterium]|nr:DUF3592 domain-containing protein [Planctomycetaceae bacterium]